MSTAKYAGVRVLIFGASGFIGRWVARLLSSAGADLQMVVRDPAEAGAVLRKYGVQGTMIAASIESAGDVRAIFERVRPTVTFNLAGYGVDRSERDAERAVLINCMAVRWIVEASAEMRDPDWQGCQIVHAGSALEYGTIGGNLAEDSVPNPTTLYGRTKLAGTNALVEESVRQGLCTACARLFTVYGPGEHAGRLLPSLVKAASTGQSVSLSTGTQTRDFTFVRDVAEGFLRLGLVRVAPGSVVNLATGHLTTVRRFGEIAASVLGMPPAALLFGALSSRTDDMAHEDVTVEKLKHLINWVPRTSIEEGVRATAEFSELNFQNAPLLNTTSG